MNPIEAGLMVNMKMNRILKGGRSTDLESMCKQKLSEYNAGGESFSWYDPTSAAMPATATAATITPATTPIATPTAATTTAIMPTNLLPIIVPPPLFEPIPRRKEYPKKQPIEPSAYFVISKCVAIDLSDLIAGFPIESMQLLRFYIILIKNEYI